MTAVLVAGGLLVAGCGDSGTDETASPSTVTASAAMSGGPGGGMGGNCTGSSAPPTVAATGAVPASGATSAVSAAVAQAEAFLATLSAEQKERPDGASVQYYGCVSSGHRRAPGRRAGRSDEDLERLRETGAQMTLAVANADMVRYSELNTELHGTVRAVARHDTATKIIEQVHAQMVRHQFRLALVPGRPHVSLPEHLAIIDAICARDPAKAEAAMRAHLASVLETLATFPARH